MKFYMKLEGEVFPCYDTRGTPDSYVEVVTHEAVVDPATQNPGNWSKPVKESGIWKSYRGVIDKTQEEIDAKESDDWKKVRSLRDSLLASSDIELLNMLADSLTTPLGKALKGKRKELRDITNPSKNGGINNPKQINFDKFKP